MVAAEALKAAQKEGRKVSAKKLAAHYAVPPSSLRRYANKADPGTTGACEWMRLVETMHATASGGLSWSLHPPHSLTQQRTREREAEGPCST